MVVRNGVVWAEDYPGGDPRARIAIGAGTRAFASLLAGSLVKDRLLSLDEPVAMTFGEWALHPLKSQVSVRSLLNGTSGVAFAPAGGRDLTAALTVEPIAAPGERFIDDAASYVLLAEIARRKLAGAGRADDPATYLTLRTLLPIGCSGIDFARDAAGAPRLYDGAAITTRGWAQTGELIRREGVWRGEQLVDENATREALRGTFAEARAGIGLWLAAPPRAAAPELAIGSDLWRGAAGAPYDLAMAAGEGGQRLFILPSAALVAVRQARAQSDAWSDAEFIALLLRDL